METSADGSRRGRKKQRTRREIVEAAKRLSVSARFDALSVEAISEAADIARATFFLHFRSKSALRACLEADLAEELAGALASGHGRAEERLRGALERLFAWGPIAGDLLQGGLALRGEPPGPLLGVLEVFAKDVQQRGDLRRDLPPGSIARVAAGSIAAMLADDRAAREDGGVDRREALLGALIGGLREPKPRLKWSARG